MGGLAGELLSISKEQKETKKANFLGSILDSSWSIIGHFIGFDIDNMDISLALMKHTVRSREVNK